MQFNLVTLFPEFFTSPLSAGLMARAVEKGVVSFGFANPRDFSTDVHRTVDDRPYGGGPGMVMLLDPLVKALENLRKPGRMLLLTPRGRPMDQSLARELAQEESVTLICGRYEGIDERLMELFPLEPVSVGDFVLNGGETGALCVVEAVSRLLPGFMGKVESGTEESFSSGLLEYPHYTRPEEFRGLRVPEVLQGGDHGKVARWRRDAALRLTLERRPELLAGAGEGWGAELSARDAEALREAAGQSTSRTLGRNLWLALVHWPVLDKWGKTAAVSLTNLDVHDISRVSRTYGLAGLWLVTPLEDQRKLAATVLGHWTAGPGAASNPDRAEALSLARVAESIQAAVAGIAAQTGQPPVVVATSARLPRRGATLAMGQVRQWLRDRPVLLLLGTGHGLAKAALAEAAGVLPPIRFLAGYNHLPVRAAAAITLDRLLGDNH